MILYHYFWWQVFVVVYKNSNVATYVPQTPTTSADPLSVIYTYTLIIFDVDFISFLKKAFHYVLMTTFNCHTEGSILIKKKNLSTSYKLINSGIRVTYRHITELENDLLICSTDDLGSIEVFHLRHWMWLD